MTQDLLKVVVKLHPGAPRPDYVQLNGIAGPVHTARVTPEQLAQLRADPTVAVVEPAQEYRTL